jgi:hypothetical protein
VEKRLLAKPTKAINKPRNGNPIDYQLHLLERFTGHFGVGLFQKSSRNSKPGAGGSTFFPLPASAADFSAKLAQGGFDFCLIACAGVPCNHAGFEPEFAQTSFSKATESV